MDREATELAGRWMARFLNEWKGDPDGRELETVFSCKKSKSEMPNEQRKGIWASVYAGLTAMKERFPSGGSRAQQ